jgi:transcriptional regulator with XRE-family HTH domain
MPNPPPDRLRTAREASGLTQQRAAERLGVSQPYLALLEGGRRPLTRQLALKIADLYGLGPYALPLDSQDLDAWDSASLAGAVASLGYSRFRHLRSRRQRNPALVLLAALSREDLEVRVLEALPWLAVEYYDLDWDWLTREAKQRDIQNRLGFIVTLGRQVAEKRGADAARDMLRQAGEALEHARLVREDTLCQGSLSTAERKWLRGSRPADARHWHLLTDLHSDRLPYAA